MNISPHTKLFLLLSSFLNIIANAQGNQVNAKDSIPEQLLVKKVNALFSTQPRQFVFDLNAVPEQILNNLIPLSIPHGIKMKDIPVRKFIANQGENWESTDHISNVDLPRRKFLFALTSNTEWVFVYLRGGFVQTIILVYTDSLENYALNIFNTESNKDILTKLERKGKIKKLTKTELAPIVSGEICFYHGEFWLYSIPDCGI